MRFVKSCFSFGLALSAILATAPTSRADRLFFSMTGPGGSPIANTTSLPAVPTVVLNDANPIGTLHIWMQPDVMPPAAGKTLNGLSYDIETSNPAVATATGHTLINPATTNADGDPALRWVDTGSGFPGTGNLWVERSVGSAVDALASTGIGNRDAAFTRDPMDDPTSRSFYLGSLNFTRAPGAPTARTGLYFRVGLGGTTLAGSGAAAPLQFGDGTTTYLGNAYGQGDPITGDLAQADAIIDVQGGIGPPPVSATITAHALGATDPTQIAHLNGSPRGTFVDITPNATMGRVNINNFHGQPNGDLTVFFDLVNDAQANALVTSLNAIVGRQFTASLSNFVGVNPSGRNDGDIALTFAGAGNAGSSQYIDFNFGTGNLVQAVGIPEPSTYALASLSLLGLAFYARRRRAA